MAQGDHGWEGYYQILKGRAPRQLVLDVLAYFPEYVGDEQRIANFALALSFRRPRRQANNVRYT